MPSKQAQFNAYRLFSKSKLPGGPQPSKPKLRTTYGPLDLVRDVARTAYKAVPTAPDDRMRNRWWKYEYERRNARQAGRKPPPVPKGYHG